MSDFATKKDIENIVDTAMKKQAEDFAEIFSGFANQVDGRFNKLESRIDNLEDKFDKLLNTIDGFIKRLDENETESTARDAQFEKLLAWAKKVSKKTGIPLEGF